MVATGECDWTFWRNRGVPATHPTHDMDVSTPAAGPMIHTVTVGGDAGLIPVGDIVHYIFHKQSHSVTQSTFDKPCNRLETGEDSGLMPNPINTVVPAPVWVYTMKEEPQLQCTGTHCRKGMVFAINPTVEKSFNMFQEKAIMLNSTSPLLLQKRPFPPTATSPPEAVNPPATGKPYITPDWNGMATQALASARASAVLFFPEGDGWGHYGGVGGSLPTPWK
ncbi:hypothetical protein L211DRAFT_855507 [Terfezia boudieri ATCC MYA-4762]|uniref:Cupredoxin n=1 Tax=Terfezia boudieri ATCC MYA-4762 TaxID=1051890 RepID=A0A3N4M0R4_9PEZI|nr:hypothetical protein L211DRAFT_855507 [Terfezia boudieri ATCC MYA-4762]